MASIKAIDSTSVHRLHAGQVVLELQGAIKELVENSLDAGATTIDVRIKDNGLDTIEVADNGSGIAEADWAMIGRKHHTSKLADISALAEVETFGFRGEALSSLCALCDSVTVTTATKETAPMAAILQLARDGTAKDDTGRIARPRGTTIVLSGLFVPLPVRRKEFERTVKREYAKALSLLYAYALVPSSVASSDGRNGVRLKVEAVGAGRSGKRTTLLATDGRGSLRSSVTAIWGPKALEGVHDINLELEVEVDSVMARREGISNDAQCVKVSGLISSGAWGQGRTSADRQFYYVNGRPCDLKQVGKAINEVYKSFNTNQAPMAILDFQIPSGSVDINVSPDKRTIFLHSEANLITALRSALEEFFAPSRSSYTIDAASQSVKIPQPTQSLLPIQRAASRSEMIDEEEIMEDHNKEDEEDDLESIHDDPEPHTLRTWEISSRPSRTTPVPPKDSVDRRVKRTLDTARSSWSPSIKAISKRANGRASSSTVREPTEKAKLRQRLSAFASQPLPAAQDESEDDELEGDEMRMIDANHTALLARNRDEEAASAGDEETEGDANVDDDDDDNADEGHDDTVRESPSTSHSTSDGRVGEDEQTVPVAAIGESVEDRDTDMDSDRDLVEQETPQVEHPTELAGVAMRSRASLRQENSRGLYRDEISSASILGEMTLRVDIDRLKSRYKQVSHGSKHSSSPRTAFTAMSEGSLTAAAGIQNRDMAQAEQALSRVISKSDFAKMEVLGQFNKGFIIARLRTDHKDTEKRQSDDLFIVDQHASDEKFNFETLQRTTVIKAQALIKPRPLQLTAGDEIVAIENLDILKTNGFEVTVDEEKAPGRGERIALSAMPVSKETTFDFKDLEQLLHLLSDGARPAGQMVRCAKARSMFAMRACRKSVMIGKSLSHSQMTTLLKNMGTIDQPWNCPHGRPTMRHLTKMEDKAKRGGHGRRIDWAQWATREYHDA